MNRNEIAGQWKQLKGRAREKWGDLTDDELDRIDGRRERLVGVLQEKYGKTEKEAGKEADDFFDSLEDASTS